MAASKKNAKLAKYIEKVVDFAYEGVEKKDTKKRITKTQLARILGIDRNEHGVNSVSSPPAQLVEVCTPGNEVPAGWMAILSDYGRIREKDPNLAAIYALLVECALRISEVLAIRPTDIDSQGKVSIKALKGSQSRIVASSLAREFLIKCAKKGITPFQDYNRFHVYREFKKLGIGMKVPGNKNKSVTHVGKHLYALAAKDAKFDVKQIQLSLGHRSAKSTESYGKRTKSDT